ncbi:MAG TPA: HD domain-containing phosphohydrolase [bacterium]|nr:HD domain-containing phosphohydrolase [bacterium]
MVAPARPPAIGPRRPGGTRSVRGSLRARLVLLFGIALIPTALLQASVYVLHHRQAAAEAYQGALRLARAVAAEVDHDIVQTEQLLAVFAEHPSVVGFDGERCSQFAARLLSPTLANVGAARPDGTVFCSAIRLIEPVSIADRPYFQRALRTGEAALGEYQIGRITQRPGINLGHPVRRGDRIVGVAFAAIDLARIHDVAAQVQLPDGGTVVVLDEDGVILARYPFPEPWVGRRAPESELRRAMRRIDSAGTALARGLDGRPRLYGIVALPVTPGGGRVHVGVGIPASAAFAAANRSFLLSLGGLAVVGLLTLAALLLGTDALLLRPFRSLRAAAERIARGDFAARVGPRQQLSELQAVAEAFDRMAEAIQQHEAERDQAEQRIIEQLQTITTLYAGAQRLTRSLDVATVAQDITRILVTALGARSALLSRAEADGELRLLAKHPPDALSAPARWDDTPEGQGASGRAVRSGSAVVVNRLSDDPATAPWETVLRPQGIASVAALPLISRERPFGVIVVTATEEGFFTAERVELLQAFANQAAAALENARLFEESERRIARLQALRAIDQAITGSLDLQLSLAVLLEQVTRELAVDAAAVLLLDRSTGSLEVAASRGFRSAPPPRARVHAGDELLRSAVLERRRVVIPDLAQAEGTSRPALVTVERFVSYIAVPLTAKGEVKGVLEVFHRARLKPDGDWLEFLEALAGQAAIAVDNAGLFENLQRSNLDLTVAYDTTLEGWSRALDLRDKETEGHTRRVTELTVALARRMGVPDEALVHIRRGALLHDIGKMGIPDSILLKPGPLTEEEWAIMRRHPVYALDLLSPIPYLRPALDIPYAHHEKWDGSGYPRGLQGEQIPLAARIFAIIDVWDALTSDRPYRRAWPRERALAHIRGEAGRHFDPAVAEAFLAALPDLETTP